MQVTNSVFLKSGGWWPCKHCYIGLYCWSYRNITELVTTDFSLFATLTGRKVLQGPRKRIFFYYRKVEQSSLLEAHLSGHYSDGVLITRCAWSLHRKCWSVESKLRSGLMQRAVGTWKVISRLWLPSMFDVLCAKSDGCFWTNCRMPFCPLTGGSAYFPLYTRLPHSAPCHLLR